MDNQETSPHENQHGREKEMLSEDQWTEVRLMGRMGKPIKQIARELGLSKNTIRKILRGGKQQQYQRRNKNPGILADFMPFLVERAPDVYYNATILYRELKEKGYSGSYSTVKLSVRPLRKVFEQAQAASVRFETPPGHQAQMDWGSAWTNIAGQRVRVHIFVLVLCYSRAVYVEFTEDEKLPTLISCHENAFRWFGGLTEEILYDNPRTIVLDRGKDSARLNPQFEDFSRYLGYKPRLCQPYRARTKGKVESGVKYVKRSFLPGRTFLSLNDLNEQVRQWIRNVADKRIHGTVHEQPAERFLRETLQPLRLHPPYTVQICQVRQVAVDCLVSYEASRYSVPWKYVRQTVEIQERQGQLFIYHRGVLVAQHQKATGKHKVIINSDHYRGLFKKSTLGKPAPDVEVRSLEVYEELAGGGQHG